MEMEAEFLQLAREAVAALEAGPPPNWAEIAAVIVSGVVGVAQLGLISWGLWRWGKDIEKQRRRTDEWVERFAAQGDVLAGIGQGLRAQSEALGELLRVQRAARKAPAPQE